MFGLRKEENQYIFKVVCDAKELKLNLYQGNRRKKQLIFDSALRIGDVWTLKTDVDLEGLSYTYEADGREFSDREALAFLGRKNFARLSDGTAIIKSEIQTEDEEIEGWDRDRALDIPYEDSVVYRLHVRGFTKDKTSSLDVGSRGTFQGIIEKIPYLKSLGINAVELMPSYEFNEVMLGNANPHMGSGKVATGRINYWGFTEDALYFAPKNAYAKENPRTEFRKLVLALHQAGIELIIDLYFPYSTHPDYIVRVMRYWRIVFHVDGIHLVGNIPQQYISKDPYLSRFKIWADYWEGSQDAKGKYLAEYNDGYQNDMRSALKGDEGRVSALMDRIKKNGNQIGQIQYIANEEGFTLWDSLSYDRKHNEKNGENNQDGTDYNFSWNCGAEGVTRRKNIDKLRRKMYRNALLSLFLSQGTPLLNAGDEFGRTKQGNNNSYCQDNRISWLDWSLLSKNQDLYLFTKALIAFRKAHPVFRQARELQGMDYKGKGLPDISFHGINAWRVDHENFRRELAVMYAGDYAGDEDFLIIYNMHWESHVFHLPHARHGKCWKLILNTEDEKGFYGEGEAIEIIKGKKEMPARSIAVLQAFEKEDKGEQKGRTFPKDAQGF